MFQNKLRQINFFILIISICSLHFRSGKFERSRFTTFFRALRFTTLELFCNTRWEHLHTMDTTNTMEIAQTNENEEHVEEPMIEDPFDYRGSTMYFKIRDMKPLGKVNGSQYVTYDKSGFRYRYTDTLDSYVEDRSITFVITITRQAKPGPGSHEMKMNDIMQSIIMNERSIGKAFRDYKGIDLGKAWKETIQSKESCEEILKSKELSQIHKQNEEQKSRQFEELISPIFNIHIIVPYDTTYIY